MGYKAAAHCNLVAFLGFCKLPQALVYEWVGGGDLKRLLADPVLRGAFSLYQRVKCFEGMARGLEALHHRCEPPVLHMDIKPENTMLVEDWCNAKLRWGDCAVATEHNSLTTGTSNCGARTKEYACPVAMETGVRTATGDIYALGLVLLQMLLGQPDAAKAKRAAT